MKNRRNKEKKLKERLEQLSTELDELQNPVTIEQTVNVQLDTLHNWCKEATELLEKLRDADTEAWYEIEPQLVNRLEWLSSALETPESN